MRKFVLLSILPLMCLMLFPSMGNALGFEGIGGSVSLFMPEGDADNTLGFGAIADLGPIVPQMNKLKGEVSADYWGSSDKYTGFGTSWKVSWSTIMVNATAKYEIPIGGSILPFAGGGLSFIRSSVSSEYEGQNAGLIGGSNNDISNTDIGLHIVGGINVPLGGSLKLIAEAKYTMGDGDIFQILGGIVVKLK